MLLPHGVAVPASFTPPSPHERARIRTTLGLPADRPVLLSVGMIDTHVKRMDYVIREVAALGALRPFLLLAGASSDETPKILEIARQELGEGRLLPFARLLREQMPLVYRAADAFRACIAARGIWPGDCRGARGGIAVRAS